MSYFSSSEIEHINGTECLKIYLKPEYAFKVKVNGEEQDQNEIYLKAPTMSNEDISNIRKCTSAFAKYEAFYNDKSFEALSKLTEDQKINLFGLIDKKQDELDTTEDEVVKKELIQKQAKKHVITILSESKTYENGQKDFYDEFYAIQFFLEKRLYRCVDSSLTQLNFEVFNSLIGEKQFFIEELFAEYVAFFSLHFPLKSLIGLNKN